MRIQLIGKLAVVESGNEVTQFPTYRSRLLLGYLAIFQKQQHPRELLADMLWPGGNPDAIRLRLNQTVAELRRAIGPFGDPFVSDRFSIRLEPSVATDSGEFFDKIREAKALTDSEARISRLGEAVELAHGELLPGFYEDWVVEAREHFSEELAGVLEELAELCAKAERWHEAVGYAKRSVAINPYSEPAQSAYIQMLLGAGRQAEAIQQYENLASMLREDFAVDPSDELANLVRRFKRAGRSHSVSLGREIEPPAHLGEAGSNPPVEDVLEYWTLAGDAERVMRLSASMVRYWNQVGELETAYRWLKRALALPGAIFAPRDARAWALLALGTAAITIGKVEEARAALRACLMLARELKDDKLIGDAYRGLGTLTTRQGKFKEGRALFERSLDALRRAQDKAGMADTLTGLGESLRFEGDLPGAEVAHREAWSLRLEMGRLDRAAHSALNLGILASRRSNFVEAAASFFDCLSSSRQEGSPTLLSDCMMEIAGICASTGRPELAACLLAASAHLRETSKTPLSLPERADYVRVLKETRRGLSRDRFSEEWEKGHSLPLQISIDLALQCCRQETPKPSP